MHSSYLFRHPYSHNYIDINVIEGVIAYEMRLFGGSLLMQTCSTAVEKFVCLLSIELKQVDYFFY